MDYDVIIIGCGIIGAACAYALSRYDLKVAVLERDNDVANGTTKANSAIIHAGYDPLPGTKMARLNVEGNRLAEEICKKLDVPYKKIGSLVLALTEEELPHIKALYDRGVANCVPGLQLLTAEETLAMEPNVSPEVQGALYAPSAGIVNPWEFALAMAETAVKNGVALFLNTNVDGIGQTDRGYVLETSKGTFSSAFVLNCAGTLTDQVSSLLSPADFRITPARGEYFLLDKSEGTRVNHVIFQCPSALGKGVLVSPTVHGNLIVGPNAVSSDPEDTTTTADGLASVRTQAVRSVPSINFRDNIRNFAGVRANSDHEDFIVEEKFGFSGFFEFAGIRSPGLSAAPALGLEAVRLLREAGLPLNEKEQYMDTRKRIRFHELSADERNALIQKEPRYGRVICRCETVTEGEIVAALHTPIPPVSVNGVKRRVGAGMGRCQGGFCAPRVQEIIARELGVSPLDVLMESEGSYVLTEETKGGANHG